MDAERRYCAVALEPVQHEGRRLGHVRRVFYRCEDLPSDLNTLWREQGCWEDEERWAAETRRGRLFLHLCKSELFRLEEAIAVARWAREHLTSLRDVTVQLIDEDSLRGELPVRMVSSPNGTVTHLDLSAWWDHLGVRASAFAEFGPWMRRGLLCPVGWYGWACGDDLEDFDGNLEHHRTRPLGQVVWP